MKKLFVFVLFISAFVLPDVKAQTSITNHYLDTLSCVGAVDTVWINQTDLSYPYALQAYVVYDSLSGATGATAYLEHYATGTKAGANTSWRVLDSTVINGVQTTDFYDVVLYGGRCRLKIVGPSSTQAVKVYMGAIRTRITVSDEK